MGPGGFTHHQENLELNLQAEGLVPAPDEEERAESRMQAYLYLLYYCLVQGTSLHP